MIIGMDPSAAILSIELVRREMTSAQPGAPVVTPHERPAHRPGRLRSRTASALLAVARRLEPQERFEAACTALPGR